MNENDVCMMIPSRTVTIDKNGTVISEILRYYKCDCGEKFSPNVSVKTLSRHLVTTHLQAVIEKKV